MKYVILDPVSKVAREVLPANYSGQNLTGKTVITVQDNFSWDGKCIDWDTLSVIDDLVGLREAKWSQIKDKRDQISQTVTTSFGVFDTDPVSRTNLLGKMQSLDLQGGFAGDTVTWKLHNNTFTELTKEEFQEACLAVSAGIEAIYQASFTLQALLGSAGTAQAIAAIDIEQGWPT